MNQDVRGFVLRFIRWASGAADPHGTACTSTGSEARRTFACRLRNAVILPAMMMGCLVPSGCGKTQQAETKIACRSPNSEKQVSVYEWKFDAIRAALLNVVPSDDTGVETASLRTLVTQQLPQEHLEHLGNIAWLTDTVRLEMEVRGEVERIEGAKPTKIRRPSN